MKNEWFTIGFLIVLVTALITLAVLQFQWVGKLSEAEKDRLSETLSASAENFVAGFNQNFRELYHTFALQIPDEEVDWVSEIGVAYENWLSITEYPDVVWAIYYIRNYRSEHPEIFSFRSDIVSAEHIDAESEPALNRWLELQRDSLITPNQSSADGSNRIVNRSNQLSGAGNRPIPFYTGPGLGETSFLFIPVQLFDLQSTGDGRPGGRVQFRLSMNQPDDGIFVKLNDHIIKTRMIPDLARTFFSDSFEDQYYLSIIRTGAKDEIYYSTAANGFPPHPDVSIPIQWSSTQNRFAVRTGADGTADTNRSNFARTIYPGWPGTDGTADTIRSAGNRLFTRPQTDASDHEHIREPGWAFWLTVSEGSLDALVNQTRSRNLMISFGVIIILGISGGMIVWFAQRSRELSDKQMLFVAGVSHELRTPITVIRSAAQNLSEGLIKSEVRRKEYARIVLKESLRLGSLVDQIMEFSGIQSGKKTYNFKEGLLSDFTKQIKSAVQPLLTEKSMTLECILKSSRESLYADWESVYVAVINLVQNAVKFSPEKSKIQFVIEDTVWKGMKAVQFTVKDAGIGISVEEQMKIFEPFYRSRSAADEQIKGNGIGLNLVKKIAEAHGGGIFVNSELGSGSTFQLIIPMDIYLS